MGRKPKLIILLLLIFVASADKLNTKSQEELQKDSNQHVSEKY
jgi:hypothetical protein